MLPNKALQATPLALRARVAPERGRWASEKPMKLGRLVVTLACMCIWGAASATEYRCPESITTSQSLSSAVKGWAASTQGPVPGSPDQGPPAQYLDGAEFSDGPPSEYAFLHPDEEHSNGSHWRARWKFEGEANIWLSCRYRTTTVRLSQKLPPTTKECVMEGDNKKGISLERISCK